MARLWCPVKMINCKSLNSTWWLKSCPILQSLSAVWQSYIESVILVQLVTSEDPNFPQKLVETKLGLKGDVSIVVVLARWFLMLLCVNLIFPSRISSRNVLQSTKNEPTFRLLPFKGPCRHLYQMDLFSNKDAASGNHLFPFLQSTPLWDLHMPSKGNR